MLALNNPNALAKVVPAFISENDFTHLDSWREEAFRLQKNPFLYALSGKLRTLGLIFCNPTSTPAWPCKKRPIPWE
ncbi:MAG: hypothetical protein HC913_13920 [Microscillaceae bacterium]|nr:hypothetical protein [Microscillaceae bacterium]